MHFSPLVLIAAIGLSGCVSNSDRPFVASDIGYSLKPTGKTVLRVEVLEVKYTGQNVGRSSWYDYRARVKEVISGQWALPEIQFVNLQHAQFIKEVTQDCYIELRPAAEQIRTEIGAKFVSSRFLSPYWSSHDTHISKLKKIYERSRIGSP